MVLRLVELEHPKVKEWLSTFDKNQSAIRVQELTAFEKFDLVIKKRLRIFLTEPLKVYKKYFYLVPRRIWYKLLKVPYPLCNENYDKLWGYTCFEGKSVLDVGADYGSTAYYFHKRGAKKVVAVEGDHKRATALKKFALTSDFVIPVETFVTSGADFLSLMDQWKPEIVKVDIEGSESLLLKLSEGELSLVPEWLIECHSDEIYQKLKRRFLSIGKVSSISFPDIRILIVKRQREEDTRSFRKH